MTIHPTAAALAKIVQMPRLEAEQIIEHVALEAPMALIGGYDVDVAILGAYIALKDEPVTGEERYARVLEAVDHLFAGLWT